VVWPGRIDTTATQQAWYLASHASYGLYSNTGLYMAGSCWVAGTSYLNQIYGSLNVQSGNVDARTGIMYLGRTVEKYNQATLSGGVIYIDLAQGMNWYVDLNQNVGGISIANTMGGLMQTVFLRLRQDGAGGRTVGGVGSWVQPGWTMSPRAYATDVLILVYEPIFGGWFASPFITNVT
jgi:hypothetical protein